jgi:hypothetical protein
LHQSIGVAVLEFFAERIARDQWRKVTRIGVPVFGNKNSRPDGCGRKSGATSKHAARIKVASMFALCQKRTKRGATKLFDHIISEREQLVWNIEPNHFCSFAVDDQLELARLFDRNISRICTPQNLID